MDKPWNGKLIISLFLLTGIFSACDTVQTAPKYTIKGTSTRTPFHIKSTFTQTQEPPPTFTPSNTPSHTPIPTDSSTPTETQTTTETITATASDEPVSPTPKPPSPTTQAEKKNSTADEPSVKVSKSTNCRTGPGISYPKVGVLKAGKSVNLIGRDKYSTYWIIKDPNKTGKKCWIWGYYATTSGNTQKLSIYTAPVQISSKASPTPKPTIKITTPPASKTPKNTSTPKTPVPTETPNLTPGTATNTPEPATATPVPSNTPIPTNTSPPSSKYCPYTSVLPGEEEKIKNLINNARAKRGLPKLKVKIQLVEAARDHGRDMTCNGIYSHTSSDGTKAWERISVALGHNKSWCYNHCCCSEIFYGGGSYLTPEIAFDWWMNHPSQDPNYKDNIHKRTILSKYSTKLGVGVIYYQHNGTIRKFYTVDFAKPK
jgi:uncharacterized protein YkwD